MTLSGDVVIAAGLSAAFRPGDRYFWLIDKEAKLTREAVICPELHREGDWVGSRF